MDDIGPYDYYVARGRSAYDIIQALTRTKSVSRLHDYAAVFSHSTNHLARYFSLASGQDGETWRFHRYDEDARQWPGHDGWMLRTYESGTPELRSLVFFAHGLRQPYEVAARWAQSFLNKEHDRERPAFLEVSGSRLRPFVEAGMGPEEAFSLIHHGIPTGMQRFKGEGKLKERLSRTQEFLSLYKQGVAVEYILAVTS